MKKTITIFTLLLLASCGSGHLTKRYKSIKVIKNDKVIEDSIYVGVYFLKEKSTPKIASKTIFDLSPKGQQAYIKEIGKKEKTSDTILQKISASLSSKKKTKTVLIDRTIINKQAVLSVANRSQMPANRISKINITLDFGNNVRILSCNKISTVFETLDLGKLNYSNTNSASISGNSNTTNLLENSTLKSFDELNSNTKKKSSSNGAGISGTVTASQTFSEEVILRQRRVALNAVIANNKLSLYQDGIVGIDLTGNLIADITFITNDTRSVDFFVFNSLYDKVTKKLIDPKQLKFSEITEVLPYLKNNIEATISYQAAFRHVVSGHSTISESDDKIKLFNGNVTNTSKQLLIDKKDFNITKHYKLTFKNINPKLPIKISGSLINKDLVFNSYEKAKNFSNWLLNKFNVKNKSLKIDNNKFSIDMPKGFNDINNIEILPY